MLTSLRTNQKYLIEFAVSVKCGTFSTAATQLGISSATLSLHLDELERAIGTQLFFKKGKKRVSQLTPYGKKIYELLVKMENELQSPRDEVKKQKYIIKIRTTTGLARLIVPDFYVNLKDLANNYAIKVITHDEDNFVKGDEILIRADILSSDDNFLEEIFKINMSLYASQNYLGVHGYPKTAEDLRHHHLLSSDLVFNYQSNSREFNPLTVNSFISDFVSDDVFTLLEMCRKGCGIIQLPDNYPGTHMLVRIDIPLKNEITNIFMSYDKSMRNKDGFRIFVTFLENYFRSSPF
ncbi:MAG: LysR family transcriptional regulator, partial [Pseudomonadota bacterium]